MKTPRRLVLLTLIALVLAPALAGANTLLLGAKLWPAVWNAYIVDAFTDILESSDPAFDVDASTGTGAVLGPVIGFQTADSVWSVSLAAMVINTFEQEMDINYAGSLVESVDLDNSRMEFDLAVNRQINDNWKVFAGYKLQLSTMTVKTTADKFEIESVVHMPTVGVGYAQAISNALVLGAQVGVLYAIPTVEVDGDEDDTFENSVGFTGEVTLSWLTRNRFIWQVGYRLQGVGVRFDADGDAKTDEYTDTFHGLTLAVIKVLDV